MTTSLRSVTAAPAHIFVYLAATLYGAVRQHVLILRQGVRHVRCGWKGDSPRSVARVQNGRRIGLGGTVRECRIVIVQQQAQMVVNVDVKISGKGDGPQSGEC